MMAEVDAAIEAGDSIGGSFVVVAEGMPIGVGSNAEWDTRLDSALAAAVMGIQAVKGVEIGLGFGVGRPARQRGPRRGGPRRDPAGCAGPTARAASRAA